MKNDVCVVCPKCQGELKELDATLTECPSCGMKYRSVFSIPDLRYPVSELENDAEMLMAERLIAAYPRAQYLELLDLSFSTSNRPQHLVSFYKRQRAQQLSRGSQFTNMFLARLKEHYALADVTWALDLGCGSGAGLVSLAHLYANVIGVDPSLPQLIMARKFCEENNIQNVQLVRAYGQHLPFRINSFSYVTAQNALEHVFDIDEVLAEVARVLKPRGCFAADSRNRYDVFFPEPHAQLRGVGLLPRAWANAYVQWRIGLKYEVFHAHLLSYGELRSALRKSFGERYCIVMPKVSAYDMPATWDAFLATLEKFKWLREGLVVIFPSHLALAQK